MPRRRSARNAPLSLVSMSCRPAALRSSTSPGHSANTRVRAVRRSKAGRGGRIALILAGRRAAADSWDRLRGPPLAPRGCDSVSLLGLWGMPPPFSRGLLVAGGSHTRRLASQCHPRLRGAVRWPLERRLIRPHQEEPAVPQEYRAASLGMDWGSSCEPKLVSAMKHNLDVYIERWYRASPINACARF
jgi:hypothetical protein